MVSSFDTDCWTKIYKGKEIIKNSKTQKILKYSPPSVTKNIDREKSWLAFNAL
jgi:Mn-dependent DtxR family transcriptional regulator